MKPSELLHLFREISKKYHFALYQSCLWVPAVKPGWLVPSYPIYYETEQKSLWNPIVVAAKYLSNSKTWVDDNTAARKIGLSPSQARMVLEACYELEGHKPSVRKQILASLQVKEVPHKSRPRRRKRE